MLFSIFAIIGFVHLATSDISVQGFSDDECAQSRVGSNVVSNAANQFESSSCISSNSFNSISTNRALPGFQCNIYADINCQNFITTVNTVGCTPVIGQGIICFRQESFENPLAGSKGTIGLGKTSVIAESNVAGTVEAAINNACGGTICDPNTKATAKFKHATDCRVVVGKTSTDFIDVCTGKEDCVQTTTVSGDFDNAAQRDYMRNLLKETMTKGITGIAIRQDDKDPELVGVMSFASVVINDPKGANLAQMAVSINTECRKTEAKPFSCGDQPFIDVVKTAVGFVPAVGGAIVSAFDVGCAVNDLING